MSVIERLRTVPAILKCLCLLFELIGFILSQLSLSPTWGAADAFCIFSMILFAPTAILLILYLLKADNICGIDLEKIDFYFAILAALIFLVISSLIVVITFSLLTAGAVFGYLTMTTYAIEAYLRYRSLH